MGIGRSSFVELMKNSLNFIDQSNKNNLLHKLLAALSLGLLLLSVLDWRELEQAQSMLAARLERLSGPKVNSARGAVRSGANQVRDQQNDVLARDLNTNWADGFSAIEAAKLNAARIETITWVAQNKTIALDYLVQTPSDLNLLTQRLIAVGLKDVRLISRQQVPGDQPEALRARVSARWPENFTESELLAQLQFAKPLKAK